jgi:hypothetical protein
MAQGVLQRVGTIGRGTYYVLAGKGDKGDIGFVSGEGDVKGTKGTILGKVGGAGTVPLPGFSGQFG